MLTANIEDGPRGPSSKHSLGATFVPKTQGIGNGIVVTSLSRRSGTLRLIQVRGELRRFAKMGGV